MEKNYTQSGQKAMKMEQFGLRMKNFLTKKVTTIFHYHHKIVQKYKLNFPCNLRNCFCPELDNFLPTHF